MISRPDAIFKVGGVGAAPGDLPHFSPSENGSSPVSLYERRRRVMSQATSCPMLLEDLAHTIGDTWTDRFGDWVRNELIWYAASFTFHLLGLSALLLLGNFTAADH